MKRLLILLGSAVLYLTVSSLAGHDEKIDTIYLKNGKTIPAKVTSVTAAHVDFVNVEKSNWDRVERKDVQKIIYHNGIAQELNPAEMRPDRRLSWTDVRLTQSIKDVARLHKRGAIEAASPLKAGGAAAARREAEAQLKKKAAALRCGMVLVTGREQKRRTGKGAWYIIRGVAYAGEQAK